MHPNAERWQPETCRAAGAAHDQVNENKTSVQTQPSLLALRRWGRFAGDVDFGLKNSILMTKSIY